MRCIVCVVASAAPLPSPPAFLRIVTLKAGADRMANDMAIELYTENVTMVSLWPGLVKTENMEGMGGDKKLDLLQPRRGLSPDQPPGDFAAALKTPLAETPLLTGRAIAALARDRNKMSRTGKVLLTAVMAREYGFVDERGVRSPPLISVKGMVAKALEPVLRAYDAFEVPDGVAATPLPPVREFFWNTLPDAPLPFWLLKLGAGAPNF